MDALRCPPGDASVDKLSGGEKRRVALCKLLLEKPDILLLDEPTNHLDAESVQWLEKHLQDYLGCVILVTHDRYFLDNVVKWVLELDRGKGIPFEGNYSAWLEAKVKRMAQESREDESRERAIRDELQWIRSSPKARQTKSKARIAAFDELVEKQANRRLGTAQILIQVPERLGSTVIEAKNLTKSFGDRVLIDNLSFSLPPGGIVGVIGPNGAGKTTLFRMITGQETPDDGSIRIGDTVKLGYVDQSRDALDPNHNVWEEVSGGAEKFYFGKNEVLTRAYVGAFNFKGADQQKKVGQLSGGERNRVHMAKMLVQGGNVLLLDEPTNDLDVETLRALEEALESLRRLRRGHQPRPLLPRPAGDAHPRLRRRQPRRMVRRQFRSVRGRQARPHGRRGGPPDEADVQKADAVAPRSGWRDCPCDRPSAPRGATPAGGAAGLPPEPVRRGFAAACPPIEPAPSALRVRIALCE